MQFEKRWYARAGHIDLSSKPGVMARHHVPAVKALSSVRDGPQYGEEPNVPPFGLRHRATMRVAHSRFL